MLLLLVFLVHEQMDIKEIVNLANKQSVPMAKIEHSFSYIN